MAISAELFLSSEANPAEADFPDDPAPSARAVFPPGLSSTPPGLKAAAISLLSAEQDGAPKAREDDELTASGVDTHVTSNSSSAASSRSDPPPAVQLPARPEPAPREGLVLEEREPSYGRLAPRGPKVGTEVHYGAYTGVTIKALLGNGRVIVDIPGVGEREAGRREYKVKKQVATYPRPATSGAPLLPITEARSSGSVSASSPLSEAQRKGSCDDSDMFGQAGSAFEAAGPRRSRRRRCGFIAGVVLLLLCVAALTVGLVEGLKTPQGQKVHKVFLQWNPEELPHFAGLELLARGGDADALSEFGI